MAVVLDRKIHALDVHVFRLRGGNLEGQRPEWPDLRNQSQKERQDPRADSRFSIPLAPFLLIALARNVIEEALLMEVGCVVHDFLFARQESHPRHLWNYYADRSPECLNGKIGIAEHIIQLETISSYKDAVQQLLRNFESYEVVVAVRGIPVLRDLHHVKSEFSADMRLGIIGVSSAVPKFPAQPWKFDDHYPVDGRMPGIVSGVMGERTQSKCILVQIRSFGDQVHYKVAAAHVVHQVAEVFVPEWIVAHVLNEGPTVCVSMRLAKIFFGRGRELFLQQGLNLVLPQQVNDFFVG